MSRNRYAQKDNHLTLDKTPLKSTPAPFFDNGYCRGKLTRHGFMLFNPKDFHGQTLDHYGEMAYSEIELLDKIIKLGDVILDVGANIGTHTLSFAKSLKSTGCVFAFEPQRLAFQFLCANILLNNHLNVFPVMAGVSDEMGELLVPVLNPNVMQNAGTMKIEGNKQGDLVRVITIDSLNLSRCNLIKIDVEGMERKVILGARQTIVKHKPAIFVENNNSATSKDLIELITELNYKCYWFFTEYLNKMDMNGKIFKPGEGFKPEINMLCLPSDWNTNVSGLEPVINAEDTGEKAIDRMRGRAGLT